MATVNLYCDSGYKQIVKTRHHELMADEPIALGGTDMGPAPYELLLASLAACTSLTLRMYADKKKWNLGRIEADLEFFRDADGREFISRVVRVSTSISDEQRQRLTEICEKTPVTKTLLRTITINTVVQNR